MISLIVCIEFVILNLWQLWQISNPGNIGPALFHSRLKSFCWEAN